MVGGGRGVQGQAAMNAGHIGPAAGGRAAKPEAVFEELARCLKAQNLGNRYLDICQVLLNILDPFYGGGQSLHQFERSYRMLGLCRRFRTGRARAKDQAIQRFAEVKSLPNYARKCGIVIRAGVNFLQVTERAEEAE